MTFKISDEDWKAMKILTAFFECAPSDLLSVLINKEIEGYKYHGKEIDTGDK